MQVPLELKNSFKLVPDVFFFIFWYLNIYACHFSVRVTNCRTLQFRTTELGVTLHKSGTEIPNAQLKLDLLGSFTFVDVCEIFLDDRGF